MNDRLAEMLRRGTTELAVEPEVSPADLERLERRRRVVKRCRFGLLEAEGELVARDRLFSTRALDVAKAWVASPRKYLTLVGDIGVGKSTAAAWSALERDKSGASSIVYCLEAHVAEWHRYRSTKHAAAWAAARAASTLVVDEVGEVALHAREDARVGLDLLIHERRGGDGRDILLGNLSDRGLAERIDDRLLDRLQDQHAGWIELLEGESLRRRAR